MEGSVIGISLGTRIAGIAVVKSKELITYRVKVFKGPWSKKKQSRILYMLDKLYGYYNVHKAAIKLIHPLHSSKEVEGLIASVITEAEKKGIQAAIYPLHEIKKSLGLKKRQSLNEYVVSKHYELRREYEMEQNSFNKYYTKMFEAIALAELV